MSIRLIDWLLRLALALVVVGVLAFCGCATPQHEYDEPQAWMVPCLFCMGTF